jgi:DNA-binding response OmpR family regulator
MSCILILEDDVALNRLMALTLETAGYAVRPATDSHQAFDHLPAGCDLILLDLGIPDMDGPTFLAGALAKGYHGKVVVVSGNVSGRKFAETMGADAFLAKPFDPEQLLAVVSKYIKPERQVSQAK